MCKNCCYRKLIFEGMTDNDRAMLAMFHKLDDKDQKVLIELIGRFPEKDNE